MQKLFVSVLVVLFGLASLNSAVAAKKVALLVGVNKYEKTGLAEQPLRYAERDVEKLSEELEKNGYEVHLLIGSGQGKQKATKTNIDAAINRMLKGISSNDLVMVCFSGHGTQLPLLDSKGKIVFDKTGRPVDDAYFCPVDAQKSAPSSLISLIRLVERLGQEGCTNLLLVDACRGTTQPWISQKSITGNELNGRIPRNSAVAFSCSAGQQAFETNDAAGGHGVFFYHVLKGIQGAAKNREGSVTWSRLMAYVQENVNDNAKVWFPNRARTAPDGRLQTPHELRNLFSVPIIANDNSSIVNIPPKRHIPIPKMRTPVVKKPVVKKRVFTKQSGKKVAFLVGVNEYKKPGFRNLQYAERDVTEVSKELKKLGFEVTIILGDKATKSNLEIMISNVVKDLSKKDMIVVMLAGHGQQTRGGDAFYCPFDASVNDESTLFSLSSLIDDTLAPNVGTKLLLVDACRNDPDPGRGRAGGIEGRRIDLPRNTAILFSCSEGEQAFENDKIKHGVFSYCILDALRGGAANQGELDWFGVLTHVSRKMISNEIKQFIPEGRRQTPIPASRVPYTVLGRMPGPSLGVFVFSDEISRQVNNKGVLIKRITPGSPSEIAGLKATKKLEDGTFVMGDLIAKIDGNEINTIENLASAMKKYVVGDIIEVSLIRDGKTISKTVHLK